MDPIRSSLLGLGTAAAPLKDSSPSEVRELPGLPGSAGLFLSALLSVGAWHTIRKAGHLHLGSLPEWYHTACPERIGHTVAFDFDLANMPVCFTADIAATDVAASACRAHEYLRESRSRIRSQFILPVTAPRGPPTAA